MSSSARKVVSISDVRSRRPLKAALRADVQRDVDRLICLAPLVGEQNPLSLPALVRHVCCLLPDPPPIDGLDHEEPGAKLRIVATQKARVPDRTHGRRFAEARATLDAVSAQIVQVDQVLSTRRRVRS
jgi:hypothetical protein